MTGRLARAMVAPAPGAPLELRRVPLPRVGPDDGLARVELVGVCGSDPKIWRGTSPRLRDNFPILLGHELVATVAEIGDRAAARWGVAPGDRVTLEYRAACGACAMCLAGEYRYCTSGIGYGGPTSFDRPPHLWGGYAEWVYLAPTARVHRVPAELPAETAILVTAVVGNSIRWLRRIGGLGVGDSVVIQGAGQQGLSAVAVAKAAGARLIAVLGRGVDARRLTFARELGADATIDVEREDAVERVAALTGGRMADLVLDVTGVPEAAEQPLDLARTLGTVVNAGNSLGGRAAPLNTAKIVSKELRYLGAFSHDSDAVRSALEFVARGSAPWERFVTHVFSLAEAEEALRTAAGERPEREAIKVAIDPWR